ncbi:ABC transporter permease [Couchioplanes caeruleus]|uniref:ABC transporter permease n=1 Tax=Couchioplanes caeruleus TaxID=56438 RepID=UPI0008FF5ED3|nr:ABC transporter permease [Couchioplanes caeruleus]
MVAAVALGAALLIALTSLGSGFREAARAPLAGIAADLVITRPDGGIPSEQTGRGVRQPFGLSTFDTGEIGQMSAVPGVDTAVGALQIWDFGPRSTITIAGVDPGQRSVGPGRILDHNLIAGRSFHPGEQRVAVLDRHYAAFYDTKVGQQVTVGGRDFSVVGVVEVKDSAQTAASNIYLPLADAQQLAGLAANQVNQVHVQVGNSADTEAVTAGITARVGQVSAITADSLVQIMGAVGRISARFSTIAAIIGGIGGLVLSWTALRGLVSERTREIGLLMAVGWRRSHVVAAFRIEALILGLVGAAVGIALGIVLAWLLSYIPAPDLVAAPPSMSGHSDAVQTTDTGLPVRVSLTAVGAAALVSLAGATGAGSLAARRATRLKPARSLVSL